MKRCPRCKRMTLLDDEDLNSLSRRDNKTYICNTCGDHEAMIDIGALEPSEIEIEFARTHKRRR